jgi:hypothetical protein
VSLPFSGGRIDRSRNQHEAHVKQPFSELHSAVFQKVELFKKLWVHCFLSLFKACNFGDKITRNVELRGLGPLNLFLIS